MCVLCGVCCVLCDVCCVLCVVFCVLCVCVCEWVCACVWVLVGVGVWRCRRVLAVVLGCVTVLSGGVVIGRGGGV
mgnify:CR=1 FL=1